MTIHFYLKFKTQPGQQLFITGSCESLGNLNTTKALPLQYFNDELWHTSINAAAINEAITYSYFLTSDTQKTLLDAEMNRTIPTEYFTNKALIIIDTWNHAGYIDNAFDTLPFKEVLLNNGKKNTPLKLANATHIFKIKCPLLQANESVCLLGQGDALNNWDIENPIILTKNNEWYATALNLSKVNFPVTYKYGIYNTTTKTVNLEEGSNRTIYTDQNKGRLVLFNDGFLRLQRFFKGAGVAIPVFSLKSKSSFGIGEFNDIKLLADWAKKTGLKLIQLLPVNDSSVDYTFKDSYPYSAISAFALHPAYINLEGLAGKTNAGILKPYLQIQQQLNNKNVVDYVEVVKHKRAILNQLYTLQKEATFNSDGYKKWFAANEYWAKPYAAFCYCRDKYKTAEFSTWKANAVYNEAEVAKLLQPKAKTFDDVAIHLYIQYYLHVQLQQATAYAHKQGVILKGDIPIGISRNSCDAWVAPALYNMAMQAGAPPDAFAVKGQNWGFPTYNWALMQQNGFKWWRNRFEQMRNYFDAFRIDHILGFFRIWSIPLDAIEGILGYFVPAIPIHVNEFNEKGIWFDNYRYTAPFINEHTLYEYFGEQVAYVKAHFLEPSGDSLKLQAAFNTQVKVENYFKTQPQNKTNKGIKIGLFNLISNVILFEVPNSNGQQFHFRITCQNTTSFKNLGTDTQQQLEALYNNYFYIRQDDFWSKEAWNKLPALKRATNMLICGEDLGMVPNCVPDVMSNLGLLTLEIQRMPKDPKRQFFHPADAPYLSVVTPSTHDMSTIRGWWEEDPALTQTFFNKELGQYGTAPAYCEPWVNKQIVMQHLYSPAMWCIFQLQDWLGTYGKLRLENPNNERINIPANPNHYWQYKMHLNLEDLLLADNVNEDILQMINNCGRG